MAHWPDIDVRFPEFCIVQFAKSPGSAQVKTRLAAALNADQRRELHSLMTQHICRTAAGANLAPLQLWVDGDLDDALFASLAEQLPVSCFHQRGPDLGARMLGAAHQVLQTRTGVIFIGSDCPFLDADYLHRAALALRDKDAVIGPAVDGGYVLLGLRRPEAALFADMPWGTDAVLALTERRLRQLDWSWTRLPPLADIDRPDDLLLLDQAHLPPELRHFAQFA